MISVTRVNYLSKLLH